MCIRDSVQIVPVLPPSDDIGDARAQDLELSEQSSAFGKEDRCWILFDETTKTTREATTDDIHLVMLGEKPRSELANRLQQHILRLAGRCQLFSNQVFADERRHAVQNRQAGPVIVSTGDGFRGFDRPWAGKNAESSKERLFVRREQVVAPGNRCMQRS